MQNRRYKLLETLLSCIFFCSHLVNAVYQDEAGTIDTHLSLIGSPQQVAFHEPVLHHGSLCYVRTSRAIIAALSCRDGSIVWRQQVSSQEALTMMAIMDDMIFTLSDSSSVAAWSAQTGHAIWTSEIPDESPAMIHTSFTEQSIYVLGKSTISKIGIDGLNQWSARLEVDCKDSVRIAISKGILHAICVLQTSGPGTTANVVVTKFDAQSGTLLNSIYIGSTDESSAGVFVGAQREPSVIWRDSKGQTHFYSLETTYRTILSSHRTGILSKVHIEPTNTGLLALLQFSHDDGTSWAEIYQFDDISKTMRHLFHMPSIRLSNSLGCTQANGQIFISRFSYDGANGRVELWDTNGHGRIDQYDVSGLDHLAASITNSAIEVTVNATKVSARLIVTSDAGHIFLLKGKRMEWSRDEALAGAVKMILIRLPETAVLEVSTPMSPSLYNFWTRGRRHLRHLAISVASPESKMTLHGLSVPQNDRFGLRQYLLAFDNFGRIWAISTFEAGRIVWSTKLPVVNGILVSAQMHEVHETNLSAPLVDVVLRVQGQVSEFRSFQVEVLTGDVVPNKLSASTVQIPARAVSIQKLVAVRATANEITLARLDSGKWRTTWTFNPPEGHRIVAKATAPEESIASVGRVLGDRGVLYKYIDQSSLAIVTVNTVEQTLTLFLVDVMDGRILYQKTHYHVGTAKQVHLVKSENWVCYHFWTGGEVNAYQIVVTELYQGSRNHKSVDSTDIHALTQAYLYNYELTTMATTNSGQGITSRDLIIALASNEITTISRRLLDPRRREKGEITAADKEEMLIPYEAHLPQDPSLVLSHQNNVLGIEHIISGPTLLESTGLVCAFGLDIFVTRVTPSMPFDKLSATFSKTQIGISLFVLCAAIAFTRPIAAKKRLDSRWIYFS